MCAVADVETVSFIWLSDISDVELGIAFRTLSGQVRGRDFRGLDMDSFMQQLHQAFVDAIKETVDSVTVEERKSTLGGLLTQIWETISNNLGRADT
jgi:hypothetical protein